MNIYPESLINEYDAYQDVVDGLVENDISIKWHIGASDKTNSTQLKCKKCGSDKFHVARDEGQYFTAIKCPNCEYEICIHEG